MFACFCWIWNFTICQNRAVLCPVNIHSFIHIEYVYSASSRKLLKGAHYIEVLTTQRCSRLREAHYTKMLITHRRSLRGHPFMTSTRGGGRGAGGGGWG